MTIDKNPRHRRKSGFPALCLALFAAGCSVAPPGAEIHDPYEPRNRAIHEFNKDVDRALVRPVAQVAGAAPVEFTTPVINFSDNVALPGMVLNGLLQGDVDGAATNAFRFALNTTIGVLGLADPASVLGLEEVETDFGETLAVWGVPEGAYLELPLIGPSTERDAAGRIVDALIDPLERFGRPEQVDYGRAAWIAEQVIERGQFGDSVDSVLYESADSYAQSRLLYLQNRRFELGDAAGSDTPGTFVDPFADPFEDP